MMVLMQELTSAEYDQIAEDLTASGSYSSERESSSQHHSPVNTEL